MLNSLASQCCFPSVYRCLLTLAVLCAGHGALAQEGDQFEGAVWQFEMSQKKSPDTKLVGRYRIANHVVFQKDVPSDPQFSKQVGKNQPDGKRTKMEVTDFRVFEQPSKKQQRVAGTARLKMVKFGEWTGVFTDEKGVNWDMKCTRIMG